jgi:hypothetical protein
MRSNRLFFLALVVSACGGYSGDESGGGIGVPAPTSGGGGAGQGRPGQLTAGDWDDNLNFDVYARYVRELLQTMQLPAVDTTGRITIRVTDAEGRALNNVCVIVGAGEGKWIGFTGTDGKVLFLPAVDRAALDGVTVTLQLGEDETTLGAPAGPRWDLTLPGARGRPTTAVDLAFVIDATGSMADEMEYLKVEVQGIVDRLRQEWPDLTLRLALIVYRDHGDEYVTRVFDFTDDAAAFRRNLAGQRADGGGDLPEAAERALEAMNQLEWRAGDVARLAFFLADAPPHGENAGRFLDEALLARERGIRIYSIAASGVREVAEYLLRAAAQVTLGRYIFLTDDSGIGNPHAEPHIPCYQVQYLKDVLLRALRSEIAGRRIEAEPREVLRTMGNPVNGICAGR